MTATKTKQHENKAKFAGHHQIPILFASNVHNHHDFYFIVSPYCLNHKYYYFKQTNKKGKKILLLSQLYQQTLALCPVPLCSLLKAYYVLQAEAIVAALLHD